MADLIWNIFGLIGVTSVLGFIGVVILASRAPTSEENE